VKEVSDSKDFALLEALAAGVADAIVTGFPVESVLVRVRKRPRGWRSSGRPLARSAPDRDRHRVGRDRTFLPGRRPRTA
jgi:hypothetical protein